MAVSTAEPWSYVHSTKPTFHALSAGNGGLINCVLRRARSRNPPTREREREITFVQSYGSFLYNSFVFILMTQTRSLPVGI
jgi:hypothetical protein